MSNFIQIGSGADRRLFNVDTIQAIRIEPNRAGGDELCARIYFTTTEFPETVGAGEPADVLSLFVESLGDALSHSDLRGTSIKIDSFLADAQEDVKQDRYEAKQAAVA